MKKLKKILSGVLALTMVCSMGVTSVSAYTTDEDIYMTTATNTDAGLYEDLTGS